MTRSNAREVAVHLIYEIDYTGEDPAQAIETRMDRSYYSGLSAENDVYAERPSKKQMDYIRACVTGVCEHAEELDALIAQFGTPDETAQELLSSISPEQLQTYQKQYRRRCILAAALAILLGAGYFGISASAFVFGLLAVAAAYAVSCMSRTNQTIALILAGMMVSSLFSAGTSYLKLVADTQQQLPAITYWLMGSLSSIKPRDVLFLVIPVTLGLVPLLILSWRMNLLTLGEEEARSMGVNTRLLRFTVILCATLLTAASVAVSGMIGWVGLVIPHFCRMLFGYDYRRLIPAAALFGASFLIIVDDIARLATAGEIPLGILTAFVGAPIFLYLILTGGARRGN